jgi:hypothetical protein
MTCAIVVDEALTAARSVEPTPQRRAQRSVGWPRSRRSRRDEHAAGAGSA